MKKLGLDIKLAEENARKVDELTTQLALERKIHEDEIKRLTAENELLRTRLSQLDTEKIAACIEDYSKSSSSMLNAVMARMKDAGLEEMGVFIASEFAKRDELISEITRKLNFLSLSATKKSEKQTKDQNGLKAGQTIDADNVKHAAREDARSRGNNGARHNTHDEVPCEMEVAELFPEGYSREDLNGGHIIDRRRIYRFIYVKGHVRKVFTDVMTVISADGRILKAAPPRTPLLGSAYDSSFCSHVIVSKFGWHQPVSSVVRQLEDSGFSAIESTLNGLIMKICSSGFFRNMDAVLEMAVCDSIYSQMDESYGYVKTLTTKPEGDFIKQCWFWGLLAMESKLIRYSCSEGSRSDSVGYGIVSMIDHFCIIQSDGKSCYRNMGRDDMYPNITRVGCSQHLKRKFKTDEPRALEIYTMLNQLYVLEHERIRLSAEDKERGEEWTLERHLEWRREKMLPVLADAERHMGNVLDGKPDPGTKAFELSGQPISEELRKAIKYALKEVSAIENIFKQDVLCDLDSNAMERANHTFGCHRRNSKAFGSMDAAENQAILISLIESAKMWKLNLEEYMKHVLDAMSVSGNEIIKGRGSEHFERYRNLLPDRYATSHPKIKTTYPAPPLPDGPLNDGSKRNAYKKRNHKTDCPQGQAILSDTGPDAG